MHEGQIVIYKNGDKLFLAKIKKVIDDKNVLIQTHTGPTAARCSTDLLYELENEYAFTIFKKSADPTDINESEIRRFVSEVTEKLQLQNFTDVLTSALENKTSNIKTTTPILTLLESAIKSAIKLVEEKPITLRELFKLGLSPVFSENGIYLGEGVYDFNAEQLDFKCNVFEVRQLKKEVYVTKDSALALKKLASNDCGFKSIADGLF